MSEQELIENLSRIVDEVSHENDADVCLFAGPVDLGSERTLNDLVVANQSRPNVFLVLTTFGGSADVAYQIVRCLQRNYDEFKLFVHSMCKSAGTLIAVGANEIIMSDTTEMGPLDVQIATPGELGEYSSGLTPIQALDTLRAEMFRAFEHYFLQLRFRSGGQVTTRTAADIAAEMAIGSFRPIYEQFDPMRLGDNQRTNLIAYEYGHRIKTKNVKEDTLERLIAEYPSHAFVIDRVEAETLFHRVREPIPAEEALAQCLRQLGENLLELSEPLIRFLSTTGATDSEERDDEQGESDTRQVGEVPRETGENCTADVGPNEQDDEESPTEAPETNSSNQDA